MLKVILRKKIIVAIVALSVLMLSNFVYVGGVRPTHFTKYNI